MIPRSWFGRNTRWGFSSASESEASEDVDLAKVVEEAKMEGMTEDEILALIEQQNSMLAEDKKATLKITASPAQTQNHNNNQAVDTTTAEAEVKSPDDEVAAEWTAMLDNWEEKFRKKARHVTDLAHKGIPTGLRGIVWMRAATAAKALRKTSILQKFGTPGPVETDTIRDEYATLLEIVSPHEKQINRDIARTFPSHEAFKQKAGVGQANLYRVIKAYSNYDTEVGYCQGSPFIVGMLLLNMPEEDAFESFAILMRDFKLRGLFRPSMADLPLRLYQFDKLFKELYPELHAHFADMQIPASSFASQWFLTLFAAVLPIPCACRILDVLLLDPNNHGLCTIFRAGLVILGDSHDSLLMSNFEDILAIMSRKALDAKYVNCEDHFMNELSKLTNSVTNKKLDRLEKEYSKLQAARAKEESEVEVLRRKNADLEAEARILRAKVDALDEETKLLAEKLLQKSVLLNDTEERLDNAEQKLCEALERNSTANQIDTISQAEGTSSIAYDSDDDESMLSEPRWAPLSPKEGGYGPDFKSPTDSGNGNDVGEGQSLDTPIVDDPMV